jgi:uncharacterized protein
VRDRLLKFLREHKVLTLAVTESDGNPCAAALFYAIDDELHFYVLTDPATRHGKAMLANSSVAGTIQLDRQEWHEIQGSSFAGSVANSRMWSGRGHGRSTAPASLFSYNPT